MSKIKKIPRSLPSPRVAFKKMMAKPIMTTSASAGSCRRTSSLLTAASLPDPEVEQDLRKY
jgi:hypothetical protein